MKFNNKVYLIGLATLLLACDSPTAPRVTLTDDVGVRTADIPRGMYLTISFPYDTWTRIWTWAPVGLLTYSAYQHHVLVFCHGSGSGEIHIELTGPQGYLEVNEPINCLNSFRPKVNQTFNLTQYFLGLDGRRVANIGVTPASLAKQVAIGGNLFFEATTLSVGRPSFSLSPSPSIAAVENGDIGVECEEEGEGTLTVNFSPGDTPSSESFPLQCEHEQGSGG